MLDIPIPPLHPSVPIILATIFHHDFFIRHVIDPDATRAQKIRRAFLRDVVPAVALISLPPHSTASLVRPMTHFLRMWPMLIPPSRRNDLPWWLQCLVDGGPLGDGCGKGWELFSTYVLLSISEYGWSNAVRFHPAFRLGPMPSPIAVVAVLVLSGLVNVVLHLWSKFHNNSRGDHDGVNNMVNDSVGRTLTITEHAGLGMAALANAICEEGVSRGYFYYELVHRGRLSNGMANLAQAAAFGLWHYHGIPSGMVGVALTFVYGWIMGALMEYGGGMLLPIVAHTIADYFIFAVIARQGAVERNGRSRRKKKRQ